jgi:hypothetical protein
MLILGCHLIKGHSFSPLLPGYSESPEKTIYLKKTLREISGIFYHSPEELIAINDEEGALFFIDIKSGSFRKQSFGENGDYEDVVETPLGYFVLNSNGSLHQLDKTGNEIAVFSKEFHKSIEFESLCYDAAKNELLLICKSCGHDEAFIHAWRFSLSSNTFIDFPEFSIPIDEIRRLGKDDAIACKPSAAAFHPVSGKLYIIASVGKLLIVCSHEGKAEAVYDLNPDQFPQPEGLCFLPNGDLMISNEGGEHKASLMLWPFRPVVKP